MSVRLVLGMLLAAAVLAACGRTAPAPEKAPDKAAAQRKDDAKAPTSIGTEPDPTKPGKSISSGY